MNTYEKLHEYHIQQGNIISSNSKRLSKQGLVKDYKDIYPDLKAYFQILVVASHIFGEMFHSN